MSPLDDPALLSLDASGMLRHIASVGPELTRAWAATAELELPPTAARATNVVLAGMGGSASAGDYFASLCAESGELPVYGCRGYALPNYVAERSFVIVSSYSGETEEALSLYDDAWKRGAALLCITTGGRLGARAAEDGVPVYRIGYNGKPRTAIAHGLAPLLRIGSQLGLLTIEDADIERAAHAHQELSARDFAPTVPIDRNGAKQVATKLFGRTPFVVGSEYVAPVATRFRNQLAENGKVLGAADSFPEAAHNLIVGLGTSQAAADRVALVALESRRRSDPRTVAKLDAFCAQFEAAAIPVVRIDVGADRLLQELLAGTAWADHASYYLALLNGVDPTPITQIDQLKLAVAKPGA